MMMVMVLMMTMLMTLQGFGVLPKRGVDVRACEVFRLYKLHATKVQYSTVQYTVQYSVSGCGGAYLYDSAQEVRQLPGTVVILYCTV